jgi:hypothetical protein
VWFEHSCRDDVDRVPEESFEFDAEGGKIEQVGAGSEIDKQVHVARVIVFAAHDAAEDADVADLVRVGECEDFIPMPGQSPAEWRCRLKACGSMGIYAADSISAS